MTIAEAAIFLGVSERTIRRAIRDGSLQAQEFAGKHGKEYRINSESLEAFRAKREGQPIHPEKHTTGQYIATISDPDKGGTTGQGMSIESVVALLDKLNSFMNSIGPLDSNKPLRFPEKLPGVLTIPEVAIYLGVSPATVRGFIKDGKLRAVRLGKGWKISRRSLEAFEKKLLG